MLRILSIAFILCSSMSGSLRSEDPVFSGPQVGETLPSFQTLGLFGEREGKSFDLIAHADGGPVVIVFFHELTRPGFGLMRGITQFASERTDKGLTVGVVFLSDDMTETIKWSSNVRRLFSDKVIYSVSPDGKEGPGSYGLNRNVTLTILVGNKGKVTANFALVQPQLQSDGPAIVKAIAEVTGGGEIPTMEELDTRYAGGMNARPGGADRNMAQRGSRSETDPVLASMLRAVINKQASEQAVQDAAEKLEAYVAKNEPARKELARIANTVVNSGKIENYGTPKAQEILRKWCNQYADAREARGSTEANDRKPSDAPSPSTHDDGNDDDKDEA